MSNGGTRPAALLAGTMAGLMALVIGTFGLRTSPSLAAEAVLQPGVRVSMDGYIATIALTIANPNHVSIGLLDIRSSVPPGMEFLEASASGRFDGNSVGWINKGMGQGDASGFEYRIDTKGASGVVQTSIVYVGETSGTLEATATLGAPSAAAVAADQPEPQPTPAPSSVCSFFPLGADPASPLTETIPARWILVERSAMLARAVENCRIVYEAPATLGTDGYPTPLGRFHIHTRVEDETMDSTTIGIPRGAPGSYYLKNVLYTQYFSTDGAAIHYNYWSAPEAFGRYPGSHGCVGLMLDDARFFWDFATIGTPVIIVE